MSEISPEQHAKLKAESDRDVNDRLNKLEAAITKVPQPGKTKAPPLKTVWIDFVNAAQVELNFGLKAFECSTLKSFGQRFSADPLLRDKVRAAISQLLLVNQPALLSHYSDRVGQTHAEIVLYGRGFGALLLLSRLLKELGLVTEGRQVAYAAYVDFRDFAARFDGPGPNLVQELGKAVAAQLLTRVGWPDVQGWAENDYARVKAQGSSAELPPHAV